MFAHRRSLGSTLLTRKDQRWPGTYEVLEQGNSESILRRPLPKSSLADLDVVSQDHFRKYNSLVEQYEIVPQDQRAAYQGVSANEMDSARRRAGKIAQFKREKEIKSTLEVSSKQF